MWTKLSLKRVKYITRRTNWVLSLLSCSPSAVLLAKSSNRKREIRCFRDVDRRVRLKSDLNNCLEDL